MYVQTHVNLIKIQPQIKAAKGKLLKLAGPDPSLPIYNQLFLPGFLKGISFLIHCP